MKVIGIGGQLAAGKDVIADYLAKKLNEKSNEPWKRIGFAHAVKKVFMDTFQVSWDFIEKWKRIDEPPPGFNMNIRKSLQFIGDGFRNIQSDIWIQTAFRDDCPKIISDLRYLNEAKTIKKHGGFNILVWRPGYENADPNLSESQIRPVVAWCASTGKEGLLSSWQIDISDQLTDFDFFLINDGCLDQLYQKIDDLVLPWIEEVYKVNYSADKVGKLSLDDQVFVKKGWGSEQWLWNGSYCGKLLSVIKGKKASYHYHQVKEELFYIQKGKIILRFGFEDDINKAEVIILNEGDSFHVPVGLRHQFEAVEDTVIVEFSTTHSDDDTYRVIKGD